jgi:serine/threonine-protein kinase
VAATALALVLAALLGGATGLWWVQKRTEAEGGARAALRAAARLQEEERWSEALSEVRRAEGLLAGVATGRDLRRRARERGKDLEMARRLQEARLSLAAVTGWGLNWEAGDAAYREAFAWYGLDVTALGPRQAGEHIRSRSIRVPLAAALDDWANVRRKLGRGDWAPLVKAAREADPDPWRNRLRDALLRDDRRAVAELAATARAGELPPATAVLLAALTQGTPAAEQGLKVLERVRLRHPADLWVNHQLGLALACARPPRLEEALRYFTAAVSLRPRSAFTHYNVGEALYRRGSLDEAIAAYREALRHKKDLAGVHNSLGAALRDRGLAEEAIREFREAIRLEKGFALAYQNLSAALHDRGRLDEALAAAREAVRLKGDLPGAHLNLGAALCDKGRLDEALAAYREAIRLDRDCPQAHCNLGNALRRKGLVDEALASFREAVRLKGDLPGAHQGLGAALYQKGRLDKAVAACREAIRLDRDYAEAHCTLGVALLRKGRFRQAAEALRRGHELGSRKPRWLHPSARWLREAEDLARLDDCLSAVLAGRVVPGGALERLALAPRCRVFRKRYAAAARFYGEAFAEQPALGEDLQTDHRYNAARAAALAGTGRGRDAGELDEVRRAGLRRQALTWLRADLAAWAKQAEGASPRARRGVRQALLYWQKDPDLAELRDGEGLARLPEGERSACRKLWADVAAALATAGGPQENADAK